MEYRNPFPTVDMIINFQGGIVLIKRKNPPIEWALPGGFVDEGEALCSAAIREAKEETSLDFEPHEQFFTYSNPRRDPRRHTVATVFIGQGHGQLAAGDDAAEARVFTEKEVPTTLAFDHRQILDDYFHFLHTGKRPPANR